MKMDRVPRARIETVPRSESRFWFPEHVTIVYRVLDENGPWNDFATYEDAKARLKTRRAVEKAMHTRRANKARLAELRARREEQS